MTINTLTIRNFGIFGGEQSVALTPKPGKPVILFGGLNGGGKTTLLDSIQLAFYGHKATVSNRGRQAYHDYLESMIHRGADPADGSSITLDFQRIQDGKIQDLRVTRSWHVDGKGLEEALDVQIDGQPDLSLAENWAEYIEGYLPSSIAHLFFFDAEQIKEMAEGSQAREILRTAMNALLGLDVVDRLETDLKVLERRKRSEEANDVGAKECEEAAENVERLEKRSREATLRHGQASNEADQVAKRLRKLETKFRTEGGELFEQRDALLAQKTGVESAINREEEALRILAAGSSPLLLIPELLAELEVQARKDDEILQARGMLETLESRDASILKALSPTSSKEVGPVLTADRKERGILAKRKTLLKADASLISELEQLQITVLPNDASSIDRHLREIDRLKDQLDVIDADLARVPEQEAIAEIQDNLDSTRGLHAKSKAEVLSAQEEINVVTRQLGVAQAQLEKLEARRDAAGYEEEDRQKLLLYSQRVRATLDQFSESIIRKHTTRMERLILESFRLLLRKESLVSDLSIDPETYELQLTGGDGSPLPFDRLSAGERQLLATALLWGLARASGRPIPTIIDTPLGRLDSSHRKHLVDRYFPVASHQVILLSTDEEIHETNFKALAPAIVSSFQLNYNETDRSTEIEKGYFWKS